MYILIVKESWIEETKIGKEIRKTIKSPKEKEKFPQSDVVLNVTYVFLFLWSVVDFFDRWVLSHMKKYYLRYVYLNVQKVKNKKKRRNIKKIITKSKVKIVYEATFKFTRVGKILRVFHI